MKSFQVDIALIPVPWIYVMTSDQALKALALKPKLAIPTHSGAICRE